MNTVTTKKAKSVVLEKGQRVWISRQSLRTGTSSVDEYEIVRSNGTSAYAIKVSDKADFGRHEVRILQRSLRVTRRVYTLANERVWLTPEGFREEQDRLLLLNDTLSKASEVLQEMTQTELEEMISRYGKN